jgi:hypothetical protein
MSLFFDLIIQERERRAKQAARKSAGRALVNCRRDRRGYTLLTRPETERERRAKRKGARALDLWIKQQVARDLKIHAEQEKIVAALREAPPDDFDGSLLYHKKKRQADLIKLAEVTELSLNEFFKQNLT